MCILSEGRTSPTPPTLPVMTCKPSEAAYTIAIPKDSVRAVFKKM